MTFKVTKRLVLGFFSSLLLAVGFAHAADRLDPMSLSLRNPAIQSEGDDGSAGPCAMPCDDGSDCDR